MKRIPIQNLREGMKLRSGEQVWLIRIEGMAYHVTTNEKVHTYLSDSRITIQE